LSINEYTSYKTNIEAGYLPLEVVASIADFVAVALFMIGSLPIIAVVQRLAFPMSRFRLDFDAIQLPSCYYRPHREMA
jgi:hypothetical protein